MKFLANPIHVCVYVLLLYHIHYCLFTFSKSPAAQNCSPLIQTGTPNLQKVKWLHWCVSRGGWLNGKESACNAGDLGSIRGSGRFLRGENDDPLQYSCLRNPLDRGAWRATVYRLAMSHDLATKQQTTGRWGFKFSFPHDQHIPLAKLTHRGDIK